MRCPQCGQKDCCGADMDPEIERLTAELAECREDAERYRHVRTNPAMLLHLSNAGIHRAAEGRPVE